MKHSDGLPEKANTLIAQIDTKINKYEDTECRAQNH